MVAATDASLIVFPCCSPAGSHPAKKSAETDLFPRGPPRAPLRPSGADRKGPCQEGFPRGCTVLPMVHAHPAASARAVVSSTGVATVGDRGFAAAAIAGRRLFAATLGIAGDVELGRSLVAGRLRGA